MSDRPEINQNTIKEYYYLKEELVDFCRKNGLQTTGGKIELLNRIVRFLDTGEKSIQKTFTRRTKIIDEITLDTVIEDNFVCSEKHREFYRKEIGENFSFNVLFQKWLKTHAGKTYKDSIDAYYKILEEKKKHPQKIDKQFEYNTYIRDFFLDNRGKTLKDAIQCWNYKKSLKGTHQYEKKDLKVLEEKYGYDKGL